MSQQFKPVSDPVITRELSKPVVVSTGEKVTTLQLREPTAGDLLSVGNPVNWDPFSDPPRITFDMERMGKMLARLSGLLFNQIAMMAPNDLTDTCWDVAPFFTPGMKARPSSSPDLKSESQAPSNE